MGNCCGTGEDYGAGGAAGGKKVQTPSGSPPPVRVMTPDEEKRREQARKAAEERARQNAVRGTQRHTPKRKPKPVDAHEYDLEKGGGPDISVGARIDTDHVVGAGQVSITGRYDSKKDSFGIETAFAADDNNTIYGSYTVTDERLSSLGLETGFDVKNKRVTVDTTYFPPSDGARCKALIRQGKIKVAGTWTVGSVRSIAVDTLKAVKLDFETKLSAMETLKLAYDTKSKAAKVKYARKLDAKNKVDMEYAYAGTTPASSKNVTLKLSHAYSPKHLFSAAFNYGSKKIMTEWEWKTDNGPWTLNATFPFNASPKSGDVSIKRRFDF